MTRTAWSVVRWIARFVVLWIVDAISLVITAAIVPGVSFSGTGEPIVFLEGLFAAAVLGAINLLIRPVVLLLARPLGPIAVLAIGFVVNALALLATAAVLPDFGVSTFIAAFVAGIVFALVNAVITGVLDVDEEGSFYQNLIERRARRTPFEGASDPGRGLVMLEIDGLSYHHIQKALADGYMPTLTQMMEEDGYQPLADRLRPALADLGLPGGHHVRRQLRHPRLPLVRQRPAEAVRLEQGCRRDQRAAMPTARA